MLTATIVQSKLATGWDTPAKVSTGWRPQPSGDSVGSNEGVERITETGDTRITQDGNTRVLNESVVTTKQGTVWSDA